MVIAAMTYRVLITTGMGSGPGALGNACLKLYGESGETGKIVLTDVHENGAPTKKTFASGNTHNFLIHISDIGELRRIRLVF